jgi:hypothetical protein
MNTIKHVNNLQQVITDIYAATEHMTEEEYGSIQDQIREAIYLIDAAQIRLIDQSEDLGKDIGEGYMFS